MIAAGIAVVIVAAVTSRLGGEGLLHIGIERPH